METKYLPRETRHQEIKTGHPYTLKKKRTNTQARKNRGRDPIA